MKKIYLSIITIVLSILLISCTAKVDENEIHVGVAFYPMEDILLLIKEDLKEEGYNLKIKKFTDYQVPNNLLDKKELDANMIQHEYYLNEYNKANQTDLKIKFNIYHATYALYSRDYETLDEIPNNSEITIADDATNMTRAFYLLDQAGIIKLKDNTKIPLTEKDIIENNKNLKFNNKVPLTMLSNKYKETKLAVMYPTYALNLELEGESERLYTEKLDEVTQKYAISLATRTDNFNDKKIEVLKKALRQKKVKNFLIENYSWASKPAF